MRIYSKAGVLLLTAALVLMLLTGTALADVIRVKPVGDGSVEVRWSDNDAEKLILVPKTGEDYQADLAEYGSILIDTEGKNRIELNDMAPGQSYWVLTLNSGTGSSTPYPYKASSPADFSEWKTPPRVSGFSLREKNRVGIYATVDSFQAAALEDTENDSSHGLKWQLEYPMLRKPRSFLWQGVVTDPTGIGTVVMAGKRELSTDVDYVSNDFMPLDAYFSWLLEQRGTVPAGTYTFSIYWDGQRVLSAAFDVR